MVLTSCGDGYAACLAARRAFESFLQIPVEVEDPLTLSRYYQMKWVGESPCDPLVIAVSNSGQAARVIEAVERMRAHRALTIAITSNADSLLAKAAEKVIVPMIPEFEKSPGVRTSVLQMNRISSGDPNGGSTPEIYDGSGECVPAGTENVCRQNF